MSLPVSVKAAHDTPTQRRNSQTAPSAGAGLASTIMGWFGVDFHEILFLSFFHSEQTVKFLSRFFSLLTQPRSYKFYVCSGFKNQKINKKMLDKKSCLWTKKQMQCIEIHVSVRLRPLAFVAEAVRRDKSRRPRRRRGSQKHTGGTTGKSSLSPRIAALSPNSPPPLPPPNPGLNRAGRAPAPVCAGQTLSSYLHGNSSHQNPRREPRVDKKRFWLQVGPNGPRARTHTRVKTIASRCFGS